MFQYTLYGGTIPPPIPPRKRKQFKKNSDQMPKQCMSEQHLPHPSLKQTIIGNKLKKTQPTAQRSSSATQYGTNNSITTIQQIGIGIAHTYSSLILNATKNFKVSNNTPGFDISTFSYPVIKWMIF
jgi:hypothetical protein